MAISATVNYAINSTNSNLPLSTSFKPLHAQAIVHALPLRISAHASVPAPTLFSRLATEAIFASTAGIQSSPIGACVFIFVIVFVAVFFAFSAAPNAQASANNPHAVRCLCFCLYFYILYGGQLTHTHIWLVSTGPV